LYGAEDLTFRNVGHKHLENFEMWCWAMMEKVSWTFGMENEEVLPRVKEERNILHTKKEERITGVVRSCLGIALSNMFLKKK
jgi:hypothetical protein